MKILHTADIHIGEFPGPERGGMNCRLHDTLSCMGFLHEKAVAEQPDIILISGDLFHRSKLWADEMLFEVQQAIEWLCFLSEIAPVCLLYGTPNHDNIEAFRTMKKALPDNVNIITEPTKTNVSTKSGVIQVCGVPGFDRGYFRARNPGVSREDENLVFTEELGKIVLGLRALCEPDYPSVLIAHYTVPGANLESGQTQLFSQAEPLLLPEILDAAGFDLVALGHIHRPQKLEACRNTFYSGAINAFNFNDEGQKRGFYIHEFLDEPRHIPGNNPLIPALVSHFIVTPRRQFTTFRFTDTDVVGINTGELDAVAHNWWGWNNGVRGRIVRVLYSCSDESNKAFNKALLEKRLYDDSAFWVAEITPEQISISANRDDLSEHSAPEDNLRDYLLEKAYPDEKIAAIIEAARPIIAEASANNIVSRLTGLFEPLEIEVKNYRNYVEESFDFRTVNFCTINGMNGSGKSSLFMDAILDCLFEEPREGDLTGWIRNADDARSGSITFTFRIGEKEFRVSRTRMKSGKATLSLSESVDGEWISRSKEKIRDTQDEIVNLLGMDSLTFRSCALIMQDQYGLFLEADKESRMAILGNILGLGIYEDMEDLARVRSTEIGRDIRDWNVKIEGMADAIKNADEVETSIEAHEQRVRELNAEVEKTTPIADNLKLRLGSKREAAARAAQLHEGINALEEKKAAVGRNLAAQRDILTDAEHFLLRETQIVNGIAIYHSLLEKEKELLAGKATHDAKKQECEAMRAEIKRITRQVETDLSEEASLKAKFATINGKLEQREILAAQATEYEARKKELAAVEAAGEKWLALHNKRADLLQKHSSLKAAFESEYATRTARVNELKNKARLLGNSGCVDPDNAHCAFLKDAQEAKAQLEPYCAECREWKDKELAKIQDIEASVKAKDDEMAALGYNADHAAAMRRDIASLEQTAKDYEGLHSYAEQAKFISERLVALRGSLSETSARLQEARHALEAALRELTALEDADRAYTNLQGDIAREKHWVEKEKMLPVSRERKTAAVARIGELEGEIRQIEAEITQKLAEVAREEETASGGEGLARELEEVERSLASCNEELKERYGAIGALQKQLDHISETRDAMKNLQEAIQRLSDKAVIIEELKVAFSQDGIPHNIVRSILPMLTATANNILAQMTNGKMGMEFVTEKTLKSNSKKEVVTLDIHIEEYGKGKLPYLSKSGGEKVKSALSAILSLAEIKSSRAGIQLGMLHIDEPPFLDANGIQAYCDALETIQRRYSSLKVMAITHDPSMKARFPQSLDVIKTDAGSKVVYV